MADLMNTVIWRTATLSSLLRVVLLIVIGFPLVNAAASRIRLRLESRFGAKAGLFGGKALRYGGYVLIVTVILNQMGFRIGPLLGAAGVLGVAIGFASQTSVSNLVSGAFLLGEGAFDLGDWIQLDPAASGTVESIDLLSVKLRTFDNRLLRIPNETIIKSTLTNFSKHPIRRADIDLSVAYREDLEVVRAVLLEVAARDPLVLQEPEPMYRIRGFGASGVDLHLGVWVTREDFLVVRNRMFEQVKAALDEARIEIPFPHVSLYAGSRSDPIPVRLERSGLQSIADVGGADDASKDAET